MACTIPLLILFIEWFNYERRKQQQSTKSNGTFILTLIMSIVVENKEFTSLVRVLVSFLASGLFKYHSGKCLSIFWGITHS